MGQPFLCLLPSPQLIASEKTEKPPTPDFSPDLQRDTGSMNFVTVNISKQYHTENNEPAGDIIFLGNYDFEYSEKEQYKNKLLRHFSQYYINGSVCEDLGTPRKAEVRYVCDPATPSEIMTNVEEPALCEYVLTVKTSRTCSLPQMRPTPKAKKKSINCFPLLSSTQFSKYMESKNNKEDKHGSVLGSSKKIMNVLRNDKLSDKLFDEIVALVQKSVSSKTNPENSLFTVINAQKDMNEFIDTISSPPSTTDSKLSSQEEEAPTTPKEEDDVEDLINISSDLMKKISKIYSPEDLSKIINKIEGSAKQSSEAAQMLTNSVDSLMGRIKTAIKDVDKGIQDIEEIIKEDKELLGNLEESLENEEKKPASIESEAKKNREYIGHKEDNGVIDMGEDLNHWGVFPGKHDGKLSVKKDLSQQGENEDPDEGEIGSTEENIDVLEKQGTFDETLPSVQSNTNKKMEGFFPDLSPSEIEDNNQMLRVLAIENGMTYYEIEKLRRDREGYLFSISDQLEDDESSSSSSISSDESKEVNESENTAIHDVSDQKIDNNWAQKTSQLGDTHKN
ncbi:OS9 [Lepeophtheirus salmonis]|uniref:OS9 n=1 Tax=Lepeophtheirus salmonis TaxID=72036 RepID=A0A7R8CZA7_LEPSM|nr:OS9 [Lepeophtheirus salmonis]CAF2974698.1 OS9 [Lepeophtheirus salmonis]